MLIVCLKGRKGKADPPAVLKCRLERRSTHFKILSPLLLGVIAPCKGLWPGALITFPLTSELTRESSYHVKLFYFLLQVFSVLSYISSYPNIRWSCKLVFANAW
jgi:hypothetical protein